MSNPSNRASMRGQLTLRGVVIGVLGCVIITASSAYTALKMGALPWPIVFAAVISLFFLKLMGNASLNEANVTHTIMSAGAMVAGGLAFTIPGAWMLGYADQISWLDMFIVALAGTILGLLATALIHRHFIVDAALEFPTGNAAAQTLRATEAGGKTGKQLFGSMAIAGIYSVLRDALGVVPSMLCTLNIPGVTFAIYNSPMLLSVGFLVGFAPVAFWFAGALLGNFGIIVGGTAAGLFDVMTAQGIVKSLGMGLMMGFGVAVVLKDILPQVAGIVRGLAADSSTDTDEQSLISGSLKLDAGIIGLGVYLPFYMSLTAFLGSCVKLAYDKWAAHRDAEAGLSDEEKAAKDAAFQEQGLVVASGLLGGESIVGVILAFVSVGLSLLG